MNLKELKEKINKLCSETKNLNVPVYIYPNNRELTDLTLITDVFIVEGDYIAFETK